MITAAAGSSPGGTLVVVAAVITAVIAVVGLIGTTRGRSWVKRLFKGESLQQLTSTFADQVAATQAAYTISESERHRLEAIVSKQETEIADLRRQIEYLGTLVTARDEIKTLAAAEEHRHEKVMDHFNSLGAEIARVSSLLGRSAT